MNRLAFITSLAALAGINAARSRPVRALGLTCTPFNFNGVQQCEAGIDSVILDITASDTQHASEWCWAACIEGVFSYYGHDVDQERIVEEVWGSIVNMPGSPNRILGALNRHWTDNDGNEFGAAGATIGTNPMTAAQDLAADHPLIIGALGHAMILTSLTYLRDINGNGQVTLAEVRDPWPYNAGHRALTPQEWFGSNFAARIRVVDF